MLVKKCLVSAMIFLALLFLGFEFLYRINCKAWYFQDRNSSARAMTQPHPYMGTRLIPGKIAQRHGITISHNNLGFRGPNFELSKPNGVFRIVTLGGSSTYCTGVSDDETWQTYLASDLGNGVEVINLGIPGATSVEALIQTALLFSDLQPDLAVYYMGWNDARVQHVKNLAADWSDTHGKWMLANSLKSSAFGAFTAFGYHLNNSLINHLVLSRLGDVEMRSWPAATSAFSPKIDPRALNIFERNMKNIISLCRRQNVAVALAPQILNRAKLISEKPYGWLPFVRDKDLGMVIDAYNHSLQVIAAEEGVIFCASLLVANFDEKDFRDQGHFTASGNKKFAGALSLDLKNSVQSD